MANTPRPHKRSAADPEAVAAELRTLVREAHEAMRGLKDLIREGEKILHYGADELVEHAISDGVNTKMAELSAYVAGQAESFAAMMKAEVEVQRNWIMEHLEVIAIRETSNGLEATFGRKD